MKNRSSVVALVSFSLLGALAMACAPEAASVQPEETPAATESQAGAPTGLPTVAGSHVGTHGMVLFGQEKLYLSHIPLYSQPHNIQVVVEVAIASGVAPAEQQFATKGFSVRPSAFSLGDLALGTLRQITGTIYLGNFESGGTPAFRNVKFDVKSVVFARGMSTSTPVNPSLDYVAVGTPAQPFLVHVIDAAPSFDQIVPVKLPAESFLDAPSLEAGTLVRISNRANKVTSRLAANTRVELTKVEAPAENNGGEGGTPETDGGAPVPTTITVDVAKELSCLPGNDFYGSCPVATP